MDELRRRAQPLLDHPPVPRPPVTELRWRTRRRRQAHEAADTVVVVGCIAAIAVGVNTSSGPTRVEVGPATTSRFDGAAGLDAPDDRRADRRRARRPSSPRARARPARRWSRFPTRHSGKVVRTLYAVPPASTVSGTTIGPTGDVWITVPGTRHRMTALEDTVILDASTSEIDDVGRLNE